MHTQFRSTTWRIMSYLMLFILVLSPLANFTAQANTHEQEAEPNGPAAPGDHLVTEISLTPDSPNILRTNDQVSLSFQYVTNEKSGVRIFARPFTNGALTLNYGAHGSILYPAGSGQGSGYFTITSVNGEVVVDQIRIQMKSESTDELLFETFLPVYYLFTDATIAVTNISLTPDTPDVLGLTDHVDLTFDYINRQKGGVYIWARPFTNGGLTPNYGAHSSPLYSGGTSGSSSGWFTINSGNVVVDQIRIQITDSTKTVVLFEAFLPVYYRFMDASNIVHHIEFSPEFPDTPNVFAYDDNFSLYFNYDKSWRGDVLIFARPFSGTNLSPNYAAHSSDIYSASSGSGTGYFRLKSGPMVVDRVRIQMWDLDQTELLYEAFLPVHLLWAGAGPPPGPDMQIDAIEVTQATQDLNNSVDLVAGKRTYVRVHVSSPVNQAEVYATLRGIRGWSYLTPILSPGNPGGDITVRTSPDRGQINDSFWFELPSSWTTAGNLTLIAKLDPNGAQFDPDTSDNIKFATVNFKSTPPLRLRLFNVQYTENSNTYLAGTSHLDALESWLRRAYPINSLQVARQTFVYPSSGLPDVDELHGWLALTKLIRILFSGEDSRTVYYGVVDDGGGFMRGKAAGIPSTIAAGPSGSSTWGWDFDGSYTDWYGGHEIGHTRGRYHAEFCGAGGGVAYPHPNGRISPALSGDTAIYGFDITTRDIYGPNWKDLMTYCDNEWVSDFTYEGIRDYLVGVGLQANSIQTVTASDFLIVVGMADLETNTASLESVYMITQDATAPLPVPGAWTIALVDAGDVDLATYPFAPNELTESEENPGIPAIISEVVPWEPGTVKVEIRYDGEVVASRSASANPPSVTITSPGNEILVSDDTIDANWTGSDPDSDPLTYSVLYSNDGGSNWQTLATELEDTHLALNTDHLPGGTGLLRVLASDGFLSGNDTSNPFDVPLHAPDAQIIQPAEGQVFYPTQQVVLEGTAYDLEDGSMGDDAFQWASSINGDLGSGATLSTAELSTGMHVISMTVTDSDAMTAEVTRTLEISPEDAPEVLTLDTAPLSVSRLVGFGEAVEPFTLTLRTSGEMELGWNASEDIPWLTLGATSGTTPSDLMLSFDSSLLRVGQNIGMITITSNEAENSPIEIPVSIYVNGEVIYLPSIQN